MKQLNLTIVLLFLALCSMSAKPVTIIISNPLATERLQEMVELNANDISQNKNIVVTDAEGTEIPSQVTYDGKLIFQVPALQAKQKVVFFATEGTPSAYINKVYGRQYPERQEDFSFENDRVGYRLYGPATQKKGEKLYGYDLFNKKTTDLVLDELYADQTDGKMWATFDRLNKKGYKEQATALYMSFCYHIDHGKGMDCYKVGPTLGAGTNALIDANGNISYPWCYKSFEILDKGPLRLTVRLDYGEREVDGQKVHETRLLTIDAGTNMVKSEVNYASEKPFESNICAGIAVHTENPNGYKLNEKQGVMAYEDLGDVNVAWEGFREKQAKEMGKIFIGTVFPQQTKPSSKQNNIKEEFKEAKGIGGVTGHILTTSPYKTGTNFTYYFGSGWDRNPNTSFKTFDDWENFLSCFATSIASPLKIKLKK